MTDLGAKDHAWLLARERGEDIGHVPAEDRAPYDRLGALLGSGVAPSAGFRQRVLDAIDAAESARPAAAAAAEGVVPIDRRRLRRRRIWIAGGLAAAAAAAVLVIRPGPPATDPDAIALATEVRPGRVVVRSEAARPGQASIGDKLVVRAEVTGPAEVRVYGGSAGQLLAACNDRGGCAIERDGERRRFVLEVPLEMPGAVRAVVFAGADVPASAGSLDPDLEAAARAHRKTETRPPTPVR